MIGGSDGEKVDRPALWGFSEDLIMIVDIFEEFRGSFVDGEHFLAIFKGEGESEGKEDLSIFFDLNFKMKLILIIFIL